MKHFSIILLLSLLPLMGAQLEGELVDQFDRPIIGVGVKITQGEEVLFESLTDNQGEWAFELPEEFVSSPAVFRQGPSILITGTGIAPHQVNIYDVNGQWLNPQFNKSQHGDTLIYRPRRKVPLIYYVQLQSDDLVPTQAMMMKTQVDPVLLSYTYQGQIQSQQQIDLIPMKLKDQWARFSVRSHYLNTWNVQVDQASIRVFRDQEWQDFALNLYTDSLEYNGDFYIAEDYERVFSARIFLKDSLGNATSIGGQYPFDIQNPNLYNLPIFEAGNGLPQLNAVVSSYVSPLSFELDYNLVDYESLDTQWIYQRLILNQDTFDLTDSLDLIGIAEGEYILNWKVEVMDGDSNQVAQLGQSAVRGGMIDPRDQQHYLTKVVGKQTWMIENLNYATVGSSCYDLDSNNCDIYGRLYPSQGLDTLCPLGWKIPQREDWAELLLWVSDTLGIQPSDNNQWPGLGDAFLKSADPTLDSPVGFMALYGGFYRSGAGYQERTQSVSWWTEAPSDAGHQWWLQIQSNVVQEYQVSENWLASVRCLQET